MASLNGIPIDSEILTLHFANWVNGPATKQSGNYPSSPNGAYQNCSIVNCSNPGDGYVKSIENEGYFKSTAANTTHIQTNYSASLSNTNKFTYWAWLTHIPNNSNRVVLAGTSNDANNYLYFHLSDWPGTKTLQVFLRVGGTVQITTAQYNIIPTSNDEHLYLIMYEKDGNIFKLYYWGNGYSGEVPSYVAQPTYNLGTLNFTDKLQFSRYERDAYVATCKWHTFQIYGDVFTAEEKTAIYNAGKSLGWYGTSINNVMNLGLKTQYKNNVITVNENLFRGR